MITISSAIGFCNLRKQLLSRRSGPSWFHTLPETYHAKDIEAKWQKLWKESEGASINSNHLSKDSTKYYVVPMFPYPSGHLHMGHVRVYTIADCIARFRRMTNHQVIFPIGWDSFGLPAENAAIERGIPALEWTNTNIQYMRTQLSSLGSSFCWSREIATHRPDYYKWTQWLFLQLLNAGLAYQKEAYVNWDPVDQTVLANEQVDEKGRSWRSGAPVEQRLLKQWFLRITNYAEPLLNGLTSLNWPANVKSMQTNWIGKSTGLTISFFVEELQQSIDVFTTCPETIYGVTFIALSPTHAIASLAKKRPNLPYMATHPLTQRPIPIYVADYVVSDYASGAVMGVPSVDPRDQLFATQHQIESVAILAPNNPQSTLNEHNGSYSHLTRKQAREQIMAQPFPGARVSTHYQLRDWLISRQRYWGVPIPVIHCPDCGTLPAEILPVELPARWTSMRKDTTKPMESHAMLSTGSPLERESDWCRTTCPKCQGPAKRETDTMDTFVDSSWYFLRYLNPHSSTMAFDRRDAAAWMPVDMYIGGIEHAILHLLYARFITHFLSDQGYLPVKEPFLRLVTQGMVHGKTHKCADTDKYLKPEDIESVQGQLRVKNSGALVNVTYEKMSKSKYNGVDPLAMMDVYGADTVRLFILFKAPVEQVLTWDDSAIQGQHRFVHRIYKYYRDYFSTLDRSLFDPSQSLDTTQEPSTSTTTTSVKKKNHPRRHPLTLQMARTIEAVTEALQENISLNTAVTELMKMLNAMTSDDTVQHDSLSRVVFLQLLFPFAPHLASELWDGLLQRRIVDFPIDGRWPERMTEIPSAHEDALHTVVVQINGKVRQVLEIPQATATDSESLEQYLMTLPKLALHFQHKRVTKCIHIRDPRVVNFVLEDTVSTS